MTRLQPGRNCWRTGSVEQAAFLVDGEAYFRALASALSTATRRIWILGWDFDPRIRLLHDDPSSQTLGPTLRTLAETRPELEIRILIWAMGPLYSSHSTRLYRDHAWADHPRIHLRFDSRHPLRGAHHQKVVCLDGSTAFVGGIDLTGARWDRRSHEADSPLRQDPQGRRYGPVHDVQLLFAGEMGHSVAELCAERWFRATGERVAENPVKGPWPHGLRPDIEACHGAIARTRPGGLFRRGRREAMRLAEDMISTARHSIYLEAQYLASFRIGRLLVRSLSKDEGPEIVIVVTKSSRGIFEHFVMAHNRDRLIKRLRRADRHNRLRVAYAVTRTRDGEDVEVLVHSKVMVVDEELVRVGSSNLNNRSEGLDTECDVLLSAADPHQRHAIARFRNGLLAEHMGRQHRQVEAALAETGSLIGTIDRLNTNTRCLREFAVMPGARGPFRPVAGTGLLDPRRAFWPLQRAGTVLRPFVERLGHFFSRHR